MGRLLGGLLWALLLFCLTGGCSMEPRYSLDEGQMSEIETLKSGLDSVIGDIIEPLGLRGEETKDDLLEMLKEDGNVALRPDGSVVYTLVRRGQVIFTVKLFVRNPCCGEVEVTVLTCSDLWMDGKVNFSNLLCGLRCFGPGEEEFLSGVSRVDASMDVDVYLSDGKVARLGLEPLHSITPEGDSWNVMVVFRFEDGTTYDMTSLLLVSDMLQWFLDDEEIGKGLPYDIL